jgi:hypothetical protein
VKQGRETGRVIGKSRGIRIAAAPVDAWRRLQNANIAVRRWRVRRYVAYVARHATNRDLASEHYYDKIYSEAVLYTRDIETRLAYLVGPRRAERIILAEGRRARRPFRSALLVFLGAGAQFGPLSLTSEGVLTTAAGCVLLVAGAIVGRHQTRRAIDGFFRNKKGSGSSVLGLLTPAGRRSAVRQERNFPASVLLEPYGESLVGRLREKPETIETALLLAEEFDGTISELLETARRLD